MTSRREFVQSFGLLALTAACGGRGRTRLVTSDAQPLPPPNDALQRASCIATEPNIEGPFFLAGAPNRASLLDQSTQGESMLLRGRVTDTMCRPLPGATIEFWHADANGAYDETGYRFRCMLRTDQAGTFSLATIVPGRYKNGARFRPAHIHAKVHGENGKELTTQLYFPGDPYNDGDPFIRSPLLMTLNKGSSSLLGDFSFVL